MRREKLVATKDQGFTLSPAPKPGGPGDGRHRIYDATGQRKLQLRLEHLEI
jgi:hypothetical protein